MITITVQRIRAVDPKYGDAVAQISPYFDTASETVKLQHMWLARRHQWAVERDPRADQPADLLAFVNSILQATGNSAVPSIYGTPSPVTTPVITENRLVSVAPPLVPPVAPTSIPAQAITAPQIPSAVPNVAKDPPIPAPAGWLEQSTQIFDYTVPNKYIALLGAFIGAWFIGSQKGRR